MVHGWSKLMGFFCSALVIEWTTRFRESYPPSIKYVSCVDPACVRTPLRCVARANARVGWRPLLVHLLQCMTVLRALVFPTRFSPLPRAALGSRHEPKPDDGQWSASSTPSDSERLHNILTYFTYTFYLQDLLQPSNTNLCCVPKGMRLCCAASAAHQEGRT